LIEPLFAGSDAGVTLFRSIDATARHGQALAAGLMLRPSSMRAKSKRGSTPWKRKVKANHR